MFVVVLRVSKRILSGRWLGQSGLSGMERRFLVMQILASALAFCVFPLWILWQGILTVEMALVFGWSMGPLLAAVVLVRTRSLEAGFAVSSVAFTGLICTVCAFTGGLQSFALIWLVAVLFEAAPTRERRILGWALGSAIAGGAFLALAGGSSWLAGYPVLPVSDPFGLVFGPLAAMIYTAALAMKMQASASGYEMAIESNEARYRLLSENTCDLITQHNLSGAVVFASPASKALLGVEPQALEANGYLDRVHVADRPVYMRHLSDIVARGLPLVAEFRMKTVTRQREHKAQSGNPALLALDHDYLWVEMRSRPVWGDNQAIVGVISTTRDIAERREQEEELRKTHENLKELSDAKSRFLANMSHELRTPLNAIIGFSAILEQGLFGDLQNEKQREYVKLIHESGNHLLQVVTDILDMSKIDSGTFDIVPEAFDVKSLVHTCTGMMSQQAEMRGIELRTLVPSSLPEAVADPRACRQILINLISNALKFSDRGGLVTVGARLEGANLAYFVRDDGIGISKRDLERIGQPFFQADNGFDRRYEGTGLGVSVVKGLTELHKGHVAFESVLGEGTCVTVFIPLNCESEQTTVRVLNPGNMPANEISCTSVADMPRKTA